jgi:hypothetical protein
MVDRAPIEEFFLQKNQQEVSQGPKNVKLALSRVLNETYLAINFESQCVYFRNYMKRIVRLPLYRLSNAFRCRVFPVLWHFWRARRSRSAWWDCGKAAC